MSRRRTIAIGAGIAAAGAALGRRRPTRVPTDPFDPDAIRAETAAARTADIIAKPRVRRADLAQTYAPAIATAVDPLLHGRRYFPRMLEDIAAATNHVHLLIYGYKAGDIGETFLTALAERVAAGVEVRLAVDAIGSEVDFGSKDLFRRLREAGVEVVAYDGIVVVRSGELGERPVQAAWRGPAPFRPPQDGRHRRAGRLRRRQRHRGPLQRRALLRRHVPGRGPDRRPARSRSSSCRGATTAATRRTTRPWPNTSRPRPCASPRTPRSSAPTTVLWNVPGTGHHPDQRRHRAGARGRGRRDPHRQPVHLEPGHPRAAPRRRRCAASRSGSSPRASRRRPIRRRPSGTGTAG